MKRRSFLLTPALAAPAAVTPWVTSRPRLYFDARAVERIRRASTAGGDLQKRWTAVLESARRMLDASPVTEDVAERGGGQHANYGTPSGQISGMGLVLGLAYHVTGEKQFAEKLREFMLAYAGFKRWYGQGLDDRVPPWRSELNTARFCFGFGVGYDALHQYLSAEDRRKIADGMVRLGVLNTLDDWILPEERIHSLDSMGHNWWSVCVAMAGVAALAMLGDDARAPEWLDRIQRGFEGWFEYKGNVLQNKPANFDRNGGFYESLGYTNYALSEYLRYRLAYSNVFRGQALPRFAALERTIEFFVQTLYPASSSFWTPSFGDGSIHQSAAPTVRLLVELGFDHPAAGWYLARTSAVPGRPDPLELLFQKALPVPALPASLRQSSYYPDIGWATQRDSWKDNATFLAVKCGTAWNHAHADAGSFVLYHAGAPLIVDSGTCGYDNPAYAGYYTQSRAHNVVLFNGKGEPEEDHLRGVKFAGRLPSSLDGLGMKYVYADATGPMARYFCRNYRHWLWIGDVIIVIDDLLAYEPGRFDWVLHYEGRAEATNKRVLLTNGEARAEVRFLYPARLQMREEDGLADHRPEQKTKYLVLSVDGGVRDQKFVTAIIPGPAGGVRASEVELLNAPGSGGAAQEIRGAPGGARSISRGPDQIGVRVVHGAEITEVYLNINADGRRMHVNTNNILGGWDTDAYLLAVTRPAGTADATAETATRYFIGCGSYVRKGGRVVWSSLSKVDAVLRPGQSPELVMRSEEVVDAEIIAKERPKSVTVNGTRIAARFDGKRKLAGFRVTPPTPP